MNKALTMTARNKSFWAKSKKQQRIAVAKDVLDQIKLKFIRPWSGTYFEIGALDDKIEKTPEKLDETFALLRKNKVQCNACGIGACFVSIVNLGNNATTKKYFNSNTVVEYRNVDDDKMRQLLRLVFLPRQLSLIECAFEETTFNEDAKDRDFDEGIAKKAQRFGRRYKNDTNRMIGIMKNIIKNKGTFIP